MREVVEEICQYIADNSSDFSYGDGNTNLKDGELVAGIEGVYARSSGSPNPNMYTEIEDHIIDFWSSYANTEDAYDYLEKIYYLLHQNHHYTLTSFVVYFSHALGQVIDQGKDSEGNKVCKLSIRLITRRTIS